MSKSSKEEPVQEGFEKVEATLSRTEQYIEENQKSLTIIIAIVIVIIGGFMAYKNLYLKPLEIEANKEMFTAEQYFEKDSFNLALNGDGNYLGFIDIASNYSSTDAGNLANYYTGISYLHLGKFEEAISYLKNFKSNDELVGPISIGAIGDAQMELGRKDEAIATYQKAATKKNNELTSPLYFFKAAQALESIEKYNEAARLYNIIKNDYKNSTQARSIEKYIARTEAKLKK